MRLLILAARFPEYGSKGDQLRTRQQLELLAPDHELHVITAGRPSSQEALQDVTRLAHVTLVRAGTIARLLSAVQALIHGWPAEVGWMAPRPLRRRAGKAALSSDAVIASTVRMATGPSPTPLIIDHIDALSVSLRERARLTRAPPIRGAALIESRLLARHERRAARWAAAQIVVARADAAALPPIPEPVVIPLGVFPAHGSGNPPGPSAGGRDIDVILTGNMRYPPNRDAARWLATEIMPALQQLRPGTRIVIAGRGADRLRLDGVELIGDVPDLTALLRHARVAMVPLRAGTGVPTKLLEAAAAGAAIVATTRAATAAGVSAITADDAAELAAATARLLADEHARIALATRAQADLRPMAPSRIAAELRDVLGMVARMPDRSRPNMGRAEESR